MQPHPTRTFSASALLPLAIRAAQLMTARPEVTAIYLVGNLAAALRAQDTIPVNGAGLVIESEALLAAFAHYRSELSRHATLAHERDIRLLAARHAFQSAWPSTSGTRDPLLAFWWDPRLWVRADDGSAINVFDVWVLPEGWQDAHRHQASQTVGSEELLAELIDTAVRFDISARAFVIP